MNGEFDAPQLAVGEAFTADGTASFDRPCSCTTGIASYTWDFGDGTPVVSGPIAVHTYTQPGGYTISLTVADNETPPNTHTSNKPVVVVGDAPPPPSDIEPNQAPTPSLVASTVIGVAGETIFSFDGSDSVDPDGADETATLDYTWDFGDGSPFAAGATVTHVFMAPGTYTVRLTVTDVHNAFAIEMKDVSVTGPDGGANSPPLALIATGPTTTTVGVPLRFNGAPSYDPDGQIVSYLWTFSDSNDNLVFEQTGASVEQAFNVPDTYSVRLLVTDNDGATAEAGPILVDVAAAGTAPSPTDVGPAQPTPVPNSADQRPNGMCGVGMLTGLLGSLLGLSMMLVTRRRRMP